MGLFMLHNAAGLDEQRTVANQGPPSCRTRALPHVGRQTRERLDELFARGCEGSQGWQKVEVQVARLVDVPAWMRDVTSRLFAIAQRHHHGAPDVMAGAYMGE